MILDIKTYPNKILTKKTKKVGEINAEIKKLIEDMTETLYVKRGLGLAANQIGSSRRIAMVDAGEGLVVLINPGIVKKAGRDVMVEGCLSFPGLELEIKRPKKIEVEYLDRSGQKKKIKASDLLARAMCHEIDHLDGKTMLDRLPLLERLRTKKRLRKSGRR